MVECCRVPEFYYGSCEVRGGTWGELLECPEIHSDSGHLIEGFCESGTDYACNGHASEVRARIVTTVYTASHRSSVARATSRASWWEAPGSAPGSLAEVSGPLWVIITNYSHCKAL